MSGFSDFFSESLRPFGSPSNEHLIDKERRLAGELGSPFAAQRKTRGQVTELGDEAGRLQGLRSRVNASISNAPNRAARSNTIAANTSVQQRFGDQQTGAVTHGDILDNSLRRAKTRVGIVNRGDAAVRNQQLKDRLTQVRSGVAARGRAIDTQVAGRNIQAGVNVGLGNAKARGDASSADAAGTITGALAAALKDRSTKPAATGTVT